MELLANIKTIKTTAEGKVELTLEYVMGSIEDKANIMKLFLIQGGIVQVSFEQFEAMPNIRTLPGGKVEVSYNGQAFQKIKQEV